MRKFIYETFVTPTMANKKELSTAELAADTFPKMNLYFLPFGARSAVSVVFSVTILPLIRTMLFSVPKKIIKIEQNMCHFKKNNGSLTYSV